MILLKLKATNLIKNGLLRREFENVMVTEIIASQWFSQNSKWNSYTEDSAKLADCG